MSLLKLYLNKPTSPHFFLQTGEQVPENPNYRKKETEAQKFITSIHAQLNIISRHVQFLTRRLHKAARDFPIMDITETQYLQQIADKLKTA